MNVPAPIRVLPPEVADAIAAGEVVERPAAVVKELCENALDAGARRIEVVVEGGGIGCIRVVDDGHGIPADQLELAVMRHATSKITSAFELASVSSLGFRGEALASIAAVADVGVSSGVGGAAGRRIRVRGSEVVERGAAAPGTGTVVEVQDLFVTTPARMRFLRSPRAEAAACLRVVGDLALTRPDVGFSCTMDGRRTLRTAPGTRREALTAVLGRSAAAELRDLDSGPPDPGSGDEPTVVGAISEPRAHRGSRSGLVLAVNRRRVHNRLLAAAVEEAYRGLLPQGRHPYGLVEVIIDAGAVDVNVHPTKREVRFRDEGAVFRAVQRACWHAIQRSRPYALALGGSGESYVAEGPWTWPSPPAVLTGRGSGASGREPAGQATPGEAGPGTRADQDGGEDLASLAPLQPLGQAGSTWLVAVSATGIVLVDPHAAHEKVLYAELIASWRGPSASGESARSQLLLVPAIVECGSAVVERLTVHGELLRRCGFDVEPFGPAALRCAGVPVAMRGTDVERVLRDLLDELEAPGGAGGDRQHRLAALVACHSAVRFGDSLTPDEQQRLLDRLIRTRGGTTCPHGRPTVLVLDDAQLRRAFGRPPAPSR